MRILIVSQYFWPESFLITDFAEGMTQRGHRVDVLTGAPNYPGGRVFGGYSPWNFLCEKRGETAIFRVPLAPRGRGGGFRLALNYLSYVLSAVIFGSLHFLARGFPYEVMLVYGVSPPTQALPALWFSCFSKAKVVFWVQDLWPETLPAVGYSNKWLVRLASGLVKFIYRRCHLLLGQSRSMVGRLSRPELRAARLEYLPNWAESIFVSGQNAQGGPADLPAGFNLIFAGNFGQAQGLEDWLTATARLKGRVSFNLIFIGEGRAKADLAALAKKLDLERTVFFLGFKPLEQMPSYFAKADALLLSMKKTAAFNYVVPRKLSTYLMAGRPVLAAALGETADIINKSGAGLTCPPGDPQVLADLMETFIRLDIKDRERMSRQGRDYAEANFSRPALLERFEKLLESILTG